MIVNGIFLANHSKEINTIIPVGPEPKRVSPSAEMLFLMFEDKTIPNKIKITKKAVITSSNLLTIFQNYIIVVRTKTYLTKENRYKEKYSHWKLFYRHYMFSNSDLITFI